MSRADNIFSMQIPMPSASNGQLQAYRSTKIGVNATLLALDEKTLQIAYLFFLQLKLNPKKLPRISADLLMEILTFRFGCFIGKNGADVQGSMEQLLPYAFTTMQPFEITTKTKKIVINPSQFFPVIEFHPDILVQAVLHGDETMVCHMLKINPDLLQMGTGIDFSGRRFTGTALQAAIAATDFAPNKNSTGLCESLFDELKHQHPDHYHEIFHDQALELYTRSLRFYAQKQADKIRALTETKEKGKKIVVALKTAKQRHDAYLLAIDSKDLTQIINAHTAQDEQTPDAQKDHVFRVDPALIKAIETASDTEIQAVLNNPVIDSPLSNLLKQFRVEFTKLSQEEIIFNPQHLLNMFAAYNAFYGTFYGCVSATDLNWKKRELFWCHLVGFVQRYLPANVVQIFANPGLDDAVDTLGKNQRSFNFKYGSESIFSLSFGSNSGVGYIFGRQWPGVCGWWLSFSRTLAKLMASKNSGLGALCNARPTSRHENVL